MNTPANYSDEELKQIGAGISTVIGLLNAVATSNAVRLEILCNITARIIAAATDSAEERAEVVAAVTTDLQTDVEDYAVRFRSCDCAKCTAARAEQAAAEQAAAKEASDVIAAVSQPRNLH